MGMTSIKALAEPTRRNSVDVNPADITSMPIANTLATLRVNPEIGLTAAEGAGRRKAHGYNEVAERRGHPARRFLRKFWGISAWMLELIVALSIMPIAIGQPPIPGEARSVFDWHLRYTHKAQLTRNPIWEKKMLSIGNRLTAQAGLLLTLSLTGALLTITTVKASPVQTWPTNGWPKASPASVGLDEKVLGDLDGEIASGKYALFDSFQVFRCGNEVFERKYPHDYANIYGKEAKVKGPLNPRLTGPYNYFDPTQHPYYHGSDLHTMQSITKTVTSAIIGIAMTRGDFKATVDTPVLNYFDVTKVKNVDDRKRRMTLKDVLTMTTGLEWNEQAPYDDPRNDAERMEATNDWIGYVIDKPMATQPGKKFNYNSGATELLSYIFQKETGQNIETYGETQLFAPLGIKHHWKKTPRGLVDTEGGLYLNGEDLAKIGYLYLHDGLWNGNRILSTEWVKQSLTPAVDTGWQGLKYGFKWWLYPRKDNGRLVWMGIGFGGQRLMVFPEEQMIAVFTGWDILKDPDLDAKLADRLIPAIAKSNCSEEPQ